MPLLSLWQEQHRWDQKGFKAVMRRENPTPLRKRKLYRFSEGFYNRKCCLESRLNANFVEFWPSFASTSVSNSVRREIFSSRAAANSIRMDGKGEELSGGTEAAVTVSRGGAVHQVQISPASRASKKRRLLSSKFEQATISLADSQLYDSTSSGLGMMVCPFSITVFHQ